MYRINVFVTLSTFTCNYPKCMIYMLVLFLSPATPPFIFHLFNCYLNLNSLARIGKNLILDLENGGVDLYISSTYTRVNTVFNVAFLLR